MQQFLESNWLSILSILIGIVVAYIFYRLQKKDTASASAERKKHATYELLDVVESYIINKQRLSEHVIENLIYASERDHSVALRPTCTAISLLQDVALRLQRSRHLDIPQKSEYSEKIEELIRETREHREPTRLNELNTEPDEIITALEAMLIPERREDARKILDSLASIVERKSEISLKNEKSKELTMIMATTLLGVSTALATSLIGSKIFDSVTTSPITSMFSKLFPLMGALLAVVVALQVTVTALRIRRRDSKNSDEKQNIMANSSFKRDA
ncbi:hypothetical protein OB931_09375 [Aeromonas media]|uniref:hypothetical protein n=1 Tax=Aeromonas media TaxID=651 RepID=UPI0024C1DA5C|nr:hypothetical protein [Aeromonas media]MDM5076584.1 hypothetical protein [Aeromonas media]